MKKFTSKEKYFISCFVENCNNLLLPSLGKTISLYTFLDGTRESQEEQSKQIKFHDPFLAQTLFDISNMVDDEKFYKKQLKELQRRGYSESPHFMKTFRHVSEWLWLVESDAVRRRVINNFERKESKIKQMGKMKDLENYQSSLRDNQSSVGKKLIAEKLLLAAHVLTKHRPKNSAIPPGINRPIGTIACFVCNGFGSITPGRACSKCMGRGFLKN